MMISNAQGVGIIALGKYLPVEVRSNNYFRDVLKLDTSDEWIFPRTGIRNRHIAAADEFTSDLAAQAARHALEKASLTPRDLGQIIVATATPDYFFPPTSNIVQHKLDSSTRTPSFDLGNACNGGLAALEQAYMMVGSGLRSNVMVIGAELFSRALDYTDRTSCILFGDCGAAALVAPVENSGPYGFVMKSDGSGADDIIFPGGGTVHPASAQTLAEKLFTVRLKGQDVFKKAVTCMAEAGEEVLEETRIKKSDVNWLIPHQANERIGQALAKRLQLEDRAISYIENMGNVSAASILAAMHDAYRDGWLQQGDIILMAAIGAGYNYGGGVIQWNVPNPTPRPSGKFADHRKKSL